MTFEIRDADGWTGVEAETLDAARRACEVIAGEGYVLPLEIFPAGEHFATATMIGVDDRGAGIFTGSSITRRFEKRPRVIA